jgi:NAD(P)-dependent dehydrogenase (short-subunit alcohol dehydrogenase family)
MIKNFAGKTAVLTGAASGFGLECARIGAARGMNLVLADVEQGALDKAEAELRATGVKVLARRVDVSDAAQMQALADSVQATFGAPHFVFNNAGVGGGNGFVWERSVADWQWTLGVNLWGVIHGVRLFTPMMLQAARADPAFEGHIVNTASMAGWLATPNMAVYNASKHAVVGLSETLYHDLAMATDQIGASVLCPYFISTGIGNSERNRPAGLAAGEPTPSQQVLRALGGRHANSSRVTAAMIADEVFKAIAAHQFYIFSHPHALAPVRQRMEDALAGRNPADPYADRPEAGAKLKAAFRAAM